MAEIETRLDWRDDYECCQHIKALPFPASTEGVRHKGFIIWCQSCYDTWIDAGCPDNPADMPCFKGNGDSK